MWLFFYFLFSFSNYSVTQLDLAWLGWAVTKKYIGKKGGETKKGKNKKGKAKNKGRSYWPVQYRPVIFGPQADTVTDGTELYIDVSSITY